MFWRYLFSLSLIFHSTHSTVQQTDQWHCPYKYCWSFVLSSKSLFSTDTLDLSLTLSGELLYFAFYYVIYVLFQWLFLSLHLLWIFFPFTFSQGVDWFFFILVRIFCASKLLLYFLNSHYLVCPVSCFSLSMTHPQEILLLVCSFLLNLSSKIIIFDTFLSSYTTN